jgi:hypothetical protein
LPTGDLAGIRIAEQTTSIIRLIEVPRSDMAITLHDHQGRTLESASEQLSNIG